MQHRKLQLVSLLSLVALTACDPRLINPDIPVIIPEGALGSDRIEQVNAACYKETFNQPDVARTDKLDILFVIDTSASLLTERGNVVSNVDKFIKKLPKNSHYRIAVMLAHGSRSRWSGKLYDFGFITPVVLDSKKHSLSLIRLSLILRMSLTPMDYFADGGETPFYSLHKALEPAQLAASQRAGFFRNDAALSVVFVGDENEMCYEYPSNVTPRPDLDFYRGESLETLARRENCKVTDSKGNTRWLSASYMNERLTEFKGSQPVNVGAVVHTSKTIKHKGPRSEDEYGYGYLDLVEMTGGSAMNIRDRDYSSGMERLGQSAALSMTLYQKFALTHTDIRPSSLEVRVDSSARTEFSWLADQGSVFVADPGRAKSKVEINYCRLEANEGPELPPGGPELPPGGPELPPGGPELPPGGPEVPPTDPNDGGDLPGGCTAVDCPDIGL